MRKLTLVTFVVFALAALSFASDVPKVELFGGYSYMSIGTGIDTPGLDSRFSSNGWDASATYNFNRFFGVKADINGQYSSQDGFFNRLGPAPVTCGAITNCGLNQSMHSFLFGPQIGYRSGKLRPFAHVLMGVAHGRANLTADGRQIPGPTNEVTDDAFAVQFGGGLDYKVSKMVSVRLGQLDLLHTDLSYFPGQDSQNHFSYKAGIVLNLGGK